MKDENLWMQLANAINYRSNFDRVVWSGIAIISAANAVLLVGLLRIEIDSRGDWVEIAIPWVGLVMTIFWCMILGRNLAFLTQTDNLVKAIEKELNIPLKLKVSSRVVTRFLPGRIVTGCWLLIIIVFWLVRIAVDVSSRFDTCM